MDIQRKKYILDKNFQFSLSIKAIILPLITLLTASAILLFYASKTSNFVDKNNKHIDTIVSNQEQMIKLFLTTPALQQKDPSILKGTQTFKENIGKLKKISINSKVITQNSSIVFYFLIGVTILQTIIIFSLFIFYTHKISGPIHVMSQYLHNLRSDNPPEFRKLRKNDHLKEFHEELTLTLDYIIDKKEQNDDK